MARYLFSPSELLAIADARHTAPEHSTKIANNLVASFLGSHATVAMVAIGAEAVVDQPMAATFLGVSGVIMGVVSAIRYDGACEGAQEAMESVKT